MSETAWWATAGIVVTVLVAFIGGRAFFKRTSSSVKLVVKDHGRVSDNRIAGRDVRGPDDAPP